MGSVRPYASWPGMRGGSTRPRARSCPWSRRRGNARCREGERNECRNCTRRLVQCSRRTRKTEILQAIMLNNIPCGMTYACLFIPRKQQLHSVAISHSYSAFPSPNLRLRMLAYLPPCSYLSYRVDLRPGSVSSCCWTLGPSGSTTCLWSTLALTLAWMSQRTRQRSLSLSLSFSPPLPPSLPPSLLPLSPLTLPPFLPPPPDPR